jgi:hypothetical protein
MIQKNKIALLAIRRYSTKTEYQIRWEITPLIVEKGLRDIWWGD